METVLFCNNVISSEYMTTLQWPSIENMAVLASTSRDKLQKDLLWILAMHLVYCNVLLVKSLLNDKKWYFGMHTKAFNELLIHSSDHRFLCTGQ